jgi:hypothetical protein
VTDPDDYAGIDLDAWTPAGKASVDYAIDLLRSTHEGEIRGAERWLLEHPNEARPALLAALDTPAAQPAAVLLGWVGDDATVAPLLAAYARGGEGLRGAAAAGLARLAERDVPGSREALAAVDFDDRPAPGRS